MKGFVLLCSAQRMNVIAIAPNSVKLLCGQSNDLLYIDVKCPLD